ncbi:PREDICTED: olfactory receptor 10C1-like [Dipodomys ordii]|uniref:Olfactory receptor 10C1-like n=1 Tax=Dipodomys ordii TaxID=10020 RepID=A0A1S3GD17_DIPOR|nr:PREDICTED: olfactory receptor 10C1-like [Dipodomys ordii]
MSLNCSLWQENSLSVKRFTFAKFSEVAEQCFLLFTLILLMFLASLTGNACGPCEIDHFFCDLPPILALACGDTSHNEAAVFVVAVLCISSPFVLILASYARILVAVLVMPSPEGRHKALSTCSSHLLVVTLFYGSGTVTYLRPKASHSPGTDKLLALFYTVVTSMLNPIIYSLRNKEVKAALRRTLGKREVLSHG